MPFGWVAAAAAVVGAGVSAYDAYQQTGVENSALGMAQTQFGEQQQYATMLNNLISNPSSVTSTPGYQFNLQQGEDAVAREMGASGMLGSGNEGIALTQYGQNFATSSLTQQEQLLASLSGLQTTSSNSNLLGTSSNAGTQSFNQTGQLLASLGYMYGNGGGMGSGSGAGMYSAFGDQSSMNMPNINASEYAGALA
jgi:hypothetical protein